LWKRARKKTSREGDEYDYTTLFVEFEILFALDDRKLIRERCNVLPTPAEVDALKAELICAGDNNIDALARTPVAVPDFGVEPPPQGRDGKSQRRLGRVHISRGRGRSDYWDQSNPGGRIHRTHRVGEPRFDASDQIIHAVHVEVSAPEFRLPG
jgi:hypothetical protein